VPLDQRAPDRQLSNDSITTRFRRMKGMIRRRRQALPGIVTELIMASGETIALRGLMMAQGTCAPSEYQRMVMEKAAAAHHSALAMMLGRGTKAVLRPWHKRARANAKRLRQRR
jgi:hypothetical protein